MNDNNKGMVYSFWQLLKQHQIEIPIIQRDYAQGREDKKEIRTEFLMALYNALDNNVSIKLDFIYGSKIHDVFQPLDGQQRLTTLFLLHWYASHISVNIPSEINKVLLRFSYETRSSSREFCHELIKNTIDVLDGTTKISDKIIDSSWFFLSWKKDPTIDAMLRAIDDIHSIFFGINNLWDKLVEDKCLISFYHVELENFGLTDDLYIKMNARGKLLTPFENFKAGFQKHIDENNWGGGKDFVDSFAYKIDTVWTDLFWKHRRGSVIDASFIRFISTIAMIQFVLERADERVEKLANMQRLPESVRAEHFSKNGYQYLCECLDLYCNVYSQELDLEFGFPFWQHKPINNLFTALVYEGNVASYTQKVLFYAQTEFIRNTKGFKKQNFKDWMRVVRNIISRGDAEKTGNRPSIVRSPDTFIGVINLIKELSQGCDNIYLFLSTQQIKSSFAKEQIEEEKLKAKLILKCDRNKEIIFLTEDTNFCQGKIQFALYCIGYQSDQDEFRVESLAKIQKVIHTYLEDEKITNDFRRGLLTTSVDGSYNYYDYWWSWSGAVDANKRCLISRYRELEYFIYGTKNNGLYRNYLKQFFIKLLDKPLVRLIEEFIPPDDMPNWKVRLIKEPDLLDNKCKSKYIAIPKDESCCYLLKGIRPRNMDSCEKIV